MASQRPGHFPLSPTKKSKTKRSKRRPEDDANNSQPSRPKKNKRDSQVVGNAEEAASSEGPRRSGRAGAGTGGRAAQLEKVGNVLKEKLAHRPQRVVAATESLPDNPFAPPKKQRRRKAKVSYLVHRLKKKR